MEKMLIVLPKRLDRASAQVLAAVPAILAVALVAAWPGPLAAPQSPAGHGSPT